MPCAVMASTSRSPSASRPSTEIGIGSPPSDTILLMALPAPPRRTSSRYWRRMRTGASRDMRFGDQELAAHVVDNRRRGQKLVGARGDDAAHLVDLQADRAGIAINDEHQRLFSRRRRAGKEPLAQIDDRNYLVAQRDDPFDERRGAGN